MIQSCCDRLLSQIDSPACLKACQSGRENANVLDFLDQLIEHYNLDCFIPEPKQKTNQSKGEHGCLE